MKEMMMKGRVVFLHGIQQRSGTNYVNHLLCLHPACKQPVTCVRENWYLEQIAYLLQYIESLFKKWKNPKWGGTPVTEADFLKHLGGYLVSFLVQDVRVPPGGYLVSKTPSVRNIRFAKLLFPNAKVILLVRDPRDIAVSAQKTWGTPIVESVKAWVRSAGEIIDFEKEIRHTHLLVRYEDFLADPRSQLNQVFHFLKLQTDHYPHAEAQEAPLLGSSTTPNVWETATRTISFKGYGKWIHWPEDQRAKLNAVIQPYLDYFGYPAEVEKLPLSPLPFGEERTKLGKRLATSELLKRSGVGRGMKTI